jgi:hypothetical protein
MPRRTLAPERIHRGPAPEWAYRGLALLRPLAPILAAPAQAGTTFTTAELSRGFVRAPASGLLSGCPTADNGSADLDPSTMYGGMNDFVPKITDATK